MWSFQEHIIQEAFRAKTPNECLQHAVTILKHSHDPRLTIKSIAILCLYAVQGTVTSQQTKRQVAELMAALEKSG